MSILTLDEINAKIDVILLAWSEPGTRPAAREEFRSPKRLVGAWHYFSQPSKPHYAKPLGTASFVWKRGRSRWEE